MTYQEFPFFSEQMKRIELYRRRLPETEADLIIKPLHLPRDITTIHWWVNHPYAKTYWQMDGPIEKLYHSYEDFLMSGKGRSLMFFLNNIAVAQVDYYKATADEVGAHFEALETDFGIHLLMGLHQQPVHGLTQHVMITALAYLFTLGINRVVGEPDAGNKKANDLVKKVGFRFLKEITMSYKTANFYIYNREDFIKEHPGV